MPTDCEPWPGNTRQTQRGTLLVCNDSSTAGARTARHGHASSVHRSSPRSASRRERVQIHAHDGRPSCSHPSSRRPATSCRIRASCRTGSLSVGPSGGTWSSASRSSSANLDLGFTQLATLYAVAGTGDADGRRPGRAARTLAFGDQSHRQPDSSSAAPRAQRRRSPTGASGCSPLTPEGAALLAMFDRARADQFLAVVRPLPMAERALVAMGVAHSPATP